jgi:hypothetical protein
MRILAFPEIFIVSLYYRNLILKLLNPVYFKEVKSLDKIKKDYSSVDLIALIS